jgi:tetratricopeptide (TPR) repeat protein
MVAGARTLSLAETAADIRRTCDRHERPFFFMVGAGISCPTIPQAYEVVEHCRKEAEGAQAPAGLGAMESYAWWLENAYASPGDRQQYLQRLIEGKSVTHANLRLAHLLLDKRIANLVVTTNFDDFLSKALLLFGAQPIVCDHPRTVLRIDPERDELQIVHVHGSYWFYDCCNLAGEIEERADRPADDPSSMRDFLERLLSTRSPIVVGYSGWENDVFMSALKRRMKAGLKFNLYWFCYRAANLDVLPPFLKTDRNVRFVLPSEPPKAAEAGAGGGRDAGPAARGAGKGESQREAVLPATEVFDELIRRFDLKAPLLIRDPLGYLARHLRDSLPAAETAAGGRDLYLIGKVIETVERAKAELTRGALEPLRDALRRSQYTEAVAEGRKLTLADLDAGQLHEMVAAMASAARGLFDNSPDELAAYDLALAAGDRLAELGRADAESHARLGWALFYKGVTLGQLKRSEEEIGVYDELVRRYGGAAEPALREHVAQALVNKGVTLGQLNRSEEELAVYDEVVRRYGPEAAPALREQVAKALLYKGITLGQLNRNQEAIGVYQELVCRYGDAAEPALREQVARALYNKGAALDELKRSEEAVAAYAEVVGRYGGAAELKLRERVAKALVRKGATLGRLNRSEEEMAAYDEVVQRCGEATEPALCEWVARALVNQGYRLDQLKRSEAAIAVYDEVVRRYGEAAEAVLREQVATALVNKGVTLSRVNRSEAEVAVYDEVVRRYGQAAEPALREQVAKALLYKGITLEQLNRGQEAAGVFRDVVERYGGDSAAEVQEMVARARKKLEQRPGPAPG